MSTRKRYIVSDLYVPSTPNFELGLPCMNLNIWWSGELPEGKYMSGCMLIIYNFYLMSKKFHRTILNRLGFTRISYT